MIVVGMARKTFQKKRTAELQEISVATNLRNDASRFAINSNNGTTCMKFNHLLCCFQNWVCWCNCYHPKKCHFLLKEIGWQPNIQRRNITFDEKISWIQIRRYYLLWILMNDCGQWWFEYLFPKGLNKWWIRVCTKTKLWNKTQLLETAGYTKVLFFRDAVITNRRAKHENTLHTRIRRSPVFFNSFNSCCNCFSFLCGPFHTCSGIVQTLCYVE